jgi:hypothetical protein
MRARNGRLWRGRYLISQSLRGSNRARQRYEQRMVDTVVVKDVVMAELTDTGWLSHVFRYYPERIITPLLAGGIQR